MNKADKKMMIFILTLIAGTLFFICELVSWKYGTSKILTIILSSLSNLTFVFGFILNLSVENIDKDGNKHE